MGTLETLHSIQIPNMDHDLKYRPTLLSLSKTLSEEVKKLILKLLGKIVFDTYCSNESPLNPP